MNVEEEELRRSCRENLTHMNNVRADDSSVVIESCMM
jgi:hypothetical protein